jgi:hypothetical protein
VVSDICTGLKLILLNTGANTQLSPRSGTFSALDHTVCSPCLTVHHERSVLPDLGGMDHCLINGHTSTPRPNEPQHLNWIIRQAD